MGGLTARRSAACTSLTTSAWHRLLCWTRTGTRSTSQNMEKDAEAICPLETSGKKQSSVGSHRTPGKKQRSVGSHRQANLEERSML
mmetsp:Transcript_958/g.2070  ORF Transcript_958/g.2070 Transcript_958/m.2070 type:complete len:86 (+) Transcript_958:118-375(+)